MKTIQLFWLSATLFTAISGIHAQEDDLLSLLEEEETTEYVTASFKTDRVINLHSLESTAAGVLDIKISHRFGMVNGGLYELFGLDAASIRIGADYGVTNRITVGFGRNSFEKTFDGFAKFKFLRQSTGKRKMPVSAILFASTALKSVKWADPDRENFFSSRLYYTGYRAADCRPEIQRKFQFSIVAYGCSSQPCGNQSRGKRCICTRRGRPDKTHQKDLAECRVYVCPAGSACPRIQKYAFHRLRYRDGRACLSTSFHQFHLHDRKRLCNGNRRGLGRWRRSFRVQYFQGFHAEKTQ